MPTFMFPFISFWTMMNAELPSRSKSLTRPSVASRNCDVSTPSFTSTSAYDCMKHQLLSCIPRSCSFLAHLSHRLKVGRHAVCQWCAVENNNNSQSAPSKPAMGGQSVHFVPGSRDRRDGPRFSSLELTHREKESGRPLSSFLSPTMTST